MTTPMFGRASDTSNPTLMSLRFIRSDLVPDATTTNGFITFWMKPQREVREIHLAEIMITGIQNNDRGNIWYIQFDSITTQRFHNLDMPNNLQNAQSRAALDSALPIFIHTTPNLHSDFNNQRPVLMGTLKEQDTQLTLRIFDAAGNVPQFDKFAIMLQLYSKRDPYMPIPNANYDPYILLGGN